MRRGFVAYFMAMLAAASLLIPFTAHAGAGTGEVEQYLDIATTDTRPLSVDRLVYAAFKDIGYHAGFTSATTQLGYEMANSESGEMEGVISTLPDMEMLYPNLRRIPVPLERVDFYAFTPEGAGRKINGWGDLSGLRVGVLSDRIYLASRLPNAAVAIEKENARQLLDGLLNGEYDAAVLAENSRESAGALEGVERAGHLDTLYDYLYLHARYGDIIRDVTNSLTRLMDDGRGEDILGYGKLPEISDLKTIVHIVSSNSEVQREDQFYARLKERFKGEDSIEWYSIALNTRRFASFPGRALNVAQTLRQDCVSKNVEAIVVSGEDALHFLSEYYLQLFSGTPVVFYGIDLDYTREIRDFRESFTGIIETVSAGEVAETALKLFPGTKNVCFVSDYTSEGSAYRDLARSQLEAFGDRVNISYMENLGRDEMMNRLKNLPQDSIVLTGSYYRDAKGQYYSQNEMRRSFEMNCEVPMFTLYSMDPGYHAVGGKFPDYEAYADTVAGMLEHLLGGGSVADIPPVLDSGSLNYWVFDKDVMDEWDLSEGSLPQGARIINRTPSIWESDPKFAASLVALLLMSIAAGVGVNIFFVKYRSRLEDLRTAKELLAKDASLREVKERLERIINTAPVAFMMSVDGVVMETNDYARNMIGTSVGAFVEDFYDDVEQRRELVRQASQSEHVDARVLQYKTARGEVRRFLASFSRVEYESREAYLAWAMDLEESEKYKDELRASRQEIREVKERLENIISSSPIAYLMCVDGWIVELNESMKKNTGLSVGDHFREAYADPEQRDSYYDKVMRDGVLRNEIAKIKFADETVHRCIFNAVATDYEGQRGAVVWLLDIEQLESKNDQLRAARLNLQAILDTMPAPVNIVDAQTKQIVYGNDAYLHLYEYSSQDEIHGMPITESLGLVSRDGVTAEELVERLLKSPETTVTEIRSQMSKTGKIVYLRLVTRQIEFMDRRSVIGIMTDLSKEKELESSRHSLQMVLDMLPVAIGVVGLEKWALTYANRAALEIFGCKTFEELASRSPIGVMPEVQPDGQRTSDVALAISSAEKSSMEMQCLRMTGETFHSLITSCAIDYKGAPSLLAVIEDLTAEKEYQSRLLSAAEKEREANQLKGRFLVNMSHEIRTPMNAIIGLTEIELRKNPSRDARDIYRKINDSAKNLLQIINDILDLSKIEADKMELFDSEFELEEVLSSALLVASPRLDGKDVEFMLNVSLDLPRFLVGDRTRLWQILKNFLDNSAKYTEKGKIVLSVFENREASCEEHVSISFVVADTGIGIGEKQMQRLFMPYEQFYSEAQKKYTGTGLGMAISKQLCEIMGGSMKVESVLGQGTTISVTIPFKRAQNSETESEVIRGASLSGVNVLTVDDDSVSLGIMSGLLSGSGASCVPARCGTEAMEIILRRRDEGQQFDLIILDYMMAGLNGLETARQIQSSLSKSPKLLMVTSYQRLLLKDDLAKSGIEDIIEKPFIPSQFINKVRATLGHETGAERPREPEFIRYNGVHVLLCEDYRLNQEVATGMLSQFGITASVVENGRQALELLERRQDFDLIFMDLQMPVMDGYEATRAIRSDHRFDHIPIISLTADAMKEVVERCVETGMNDHVAKPIEFARLSEIFIKWLPESKRGGSLASPGDAIADDPMLPEDGLRRFGGNLELYERALRELASDIPEEWPDFSSILEDAEWAARYVHKLKGAAGNLAMDELYKSAVEFESSLRTSAPDRELYARLVREGGEFKRRVEERSRESGHEREQTGTLPELEQRLASLGEALRDWDPKASSAIVEELKGKQWPADYARLENLYSLALAYDFDAALETLEELEEHIK